MLDILEIQMLTPRRGRILDKENNINKLKYNSKMAKEN